jgi:IclR family pca regulon transcriptional regulator
MSLLSPGRLGSTGQIFAEAAESLDAIGPQCSQSLARGLAILECYDADTRLLGVAELAERLDASRSTTHRYVITLVALGYLEQGRERKYQLTRGVTRLGHQAMSSMSLEVQASDEMLRLERETGLAVDLGMLDGCNLVLVNSYSGYRYTRGRRRQNTPLPELAHCTALGLVLLASLPDYAQRKIVNELPLNRRVTNIKSKKALRTILEDIAEKELATNASGDAVLSTEVAVPVRAADGEVRAALGLSAVGATITPEELADAMHPHIVSAADRISARLGYRATARNWRHEDG